MAEQNVSPAVERVAASETERDWVALEQQVYQHTFGRFPIVLVRGEGTRVWDNTGKSYLDLVAGIAVNVLGHCSPIVVDALAKQARVLIHTSNLYYTIPQLELAELLAALGPVKKAFFSNSGAEANEGAIKLARKYGRMHKHGAWEVISANRSFHGRTLATTAATGQPKYQASWAPLPEGFKQVPFNDLDALKAATTPQTCAVLIEVVQGEGGIYPADKAYLQGLRAWCDEQNILLIADEVQAGMGRTGKFYSFMHYDIVPDIVTLAKGLAGGIPIGCMLATEKVAVFTPGDHGSTFGGNPLACAVGVATVNAITAPGFMEDVASKGSYFFGELLKLVEDFPLLSNVRGLGLMLALDTPEGAAPQIVKAAMEHGLLINNSSPSTIRLIPPLILSTADMDTASAILREVCRSVLARVENLEPAAR